MCIVASNKHSNEGELHPKDRLVHPLDDSKGMRLRTTGLIRFTDFVEGMHIHP